ncbi:MAG TPA: hypothetical protein VM755_00090 [Stellaceae bacterium]|nr:hypothetical protein [Stellaceae bacterium]
MGREQWRDFICSPYHAGRHLASIGSAIGKSVADAIEIAELQAFLDRVGSNRDVQVLADVIDLLRAEYLDFIDTDLARVLDHLSNEMIHVEEIIGPALRGNPRWDRTILGRLSGALAPGKYVTRTAHRSFDLPENLLLRWLVEHLTATIRDIGRRTGPEGLHPQLRAIAARSEEALRHHWMSDVPRTTVLAPQMLTSAERHRRGEYRRAAELARTRNSLGSRDPDQRWHAILMLLAVGWLEPISDDDLFELYSLVLVLDVLSNELGLGSPVEYGLLLRDRRHVALFETENGVVRVFFDQSPAVALGIQGQYTAIRDTHSGITGAERRPDILVTFDPAEKASPPQRLIVEVKKSTDGRYLSDSIYKAFGYLYDFQALWAAPIAPRIILVVPEGVAPKATNSIPEVLMISAQSRDVLAAGLRQILVRAFV